jgi:small subunit ribosomal protein S19
MSRSNWKGNYLDTIFLKRIFNKKTLYIWSRSSIIPNLLLGFTVFVYNGKLFKKLQITREKIGFKFGLFVKTRTKPSIKKQKKSKK